MGSSADGFASERLDHFSYRRLSSFTGLATLSALDVQSNCRSQTIKKNPAFRVFIRGAYLGIHYLLSRPNGRNRSSQPIFGLGRPFPLSQSKLSRLSPLWTYDSRRDAAASVVPCGPPSHPAGSATSGLCLIIFRPPNRAGFGW